PLGGKAKFTFQLTKTHLKHRFLVQYNETSLNFICRLLRREGIAFYFAHSEDGHVIHFVDDVDSLPELAPARLALQVGGGGDRLSNWEHSRSLVTGRYTERTYNYKEPTKIQEVGISASGEPAKIP